MQMWARFACERTMRGDNQFSFHLTNDVLFNNDDSDDGKQLKLTMIEPSIVTSFLSNIYAKRCFAFFRLQSNHN